MIFIHRSSALYLILFGLNTLTLDAKSVYSVFQNIPPETDFWDVDASDVNENENDDGSAWERSGLFEGDILLDPGRNGLIKRDQLWPNAVIPFFINESHFNESEIKEIFKAVYEFNTKTCVRFRPYESSDENWVVFTGKGYGCYSSVGMKGGAQRINVQRPECSKKGPFMHEMLHAVGFYHQQSAANRDDYVEILWENIVEKFKSAFTKFTNETVTDFDTGYDYGSIMHYWSTAFTKNGKDTIVAKDKSVTKLGQLNGFSEKDILKINRMYADHCHKMKSGDDVKDFDDIDFENWFKSMLE